MQVEDNCSLCFWGKPFLLAAYQVGLTIAEGLAKCDPANMQWRVHIAVSCAELGSHDSLLSNQKRQEYLCRGLKLLTALKQAGRLHACQSGLDGIV
jgi:hypothetical protein